MRPKTFGDHLVERMARIKARRLALEKAILEAGLEPGKGESMEAAEVTKMMDEQRHEIVELRTFDDKYVPPHMIESITRYIVKGGDVGGFLTAVITN